MPGRNSAFIFSADGEGAGGGRAFRCRVPSDVASKDDLLRMLAEGLWLPDDFGSTWDALSDCLRDLGWAPDPRVILIHQRLPRLPENELATYLTILRDAMRLWNARGERAFVVTFPETARERVELLLATSETASAAQA